MEYASELEDSRSECEVTSSRHRIVSSHSRRAGVRACLGQGENLKAPSKTPLWILVREPSWPRCENMVVHLLDLCRECTASQLMSSARSGVASRTRTSQDGTLWVLSLYTAPNFLNLRFGSHTCRSGTIHEQTSHLTINFYYICNTCNFRLVSLTVCRPEQSGQLASRTRRGWGLAAQIAGHAAD
jgi:hypothetical protein